MCAHFEPQHCLSSIEHNALDTFERNNTKEVKNKT